jgi:hypothetical protein
MDNDHTTVPYPILPDRFIRKVNSYPECSYGAVRVTLVLLDGRRIHDVIIGGNAICKIGQRHISCESDLDFSVSDIRNVKSDEYWIPFKECRPLNRKQANTVGFSLICGFAVSVIAVAIFGKGLLSWSLGAGVTIAGYFLGKKLFES